MNQLRQQGWKLVEKTEHWNSFAKRRVDLFGFCDAIAISDDLVLCVQTTTGNHVSARYEKLRYLPSVTHWLQSSTRRIEIHGWRKTGARGKRKQWSCRTVALKLGPTGNVVMEETPTIETEMI